jgi:hypothetical protein
MRRAIITLAVCTLAAGAAAAQDAPELLTTPPAVTEYQLRCIASGGGAGSVSVGPPTAPNPGPSSTWFVPIYFGPEAQITVSVRSSGNVSLTDSMASDANWVQQLYVSYSVTVRRGGPLYLAIFRNHARTLDAEWCVQVTPLS